MKKLFIGMIIGAAITCGIFYFIDKENENDQDANVKALLELARQNQAVNTKMSEAINDSSSTLVVHSPLTIIVMSNDEFYYYHDKDCNKLEKLNFASLNELLEAETKRKKAGELMIIIKTAPGTDAKNSIYLLDAIGRAGIQPGQYAEIALSENEKNCIKKYKKD